MADELLIQEIEEQAALFALGALSGEDEARFKLRLESRCRLCEAEVRKVQNVITALPLSATIVAPPPGLRARVLQMAGATALPAIVAMGEGTLVRANATEWLDMPVAGVQYRKLYENKTMLVRMEPGTSLPAHDHKAAEQCLVLEGSISGAGVTAYAGDFTYMPKGSAHDPLFTEEGCLLLIAYT